MRSQGPPKRLRVEWSADTADGEFADRRPRIRSPGSAYPAPPTSPGAGGPPSSTFAADLHAPAYFARRCPPEPTRQSVLGAAGSARRGGRVLSKVDEGRTGRADSSSGNPKRWVTGAAEPCLRGPAVCSVGGRPGPVSPSAWTGITLRAPLNPKISRTAGPTSPR